MKSHSTRQRHRGIDVSKQIHLGAPDLFIENIIGDNRQFSARIGVGNHTGFQPVYSRLIP